MTEIVLTAMLIIGHLIAIGLALSIFIALFFTNKKKAYIFLLFLIAGEVYVLLIVYNFSMTLGAVVLIIDACIGFLTYIFIKRKQEKIA